MTNHDHERAIELLTESEIEGLTAADAAWLQLHLAGCAECSGFAESLQAAQQAVRSITIFATPELVAATQARVRIRALEMRDRTIRIALLSASVVLCLASSVAMLAFVRPMLDWVTVRFRLPEFVAESALLLSWFLPATLVALLLLILRPHNGQQAAAASAEGRP